MMVDGFTHAGVDLTESPEIFGVLVYKPPRGEDFHNYLIFII